MHRTHTVRSAYCDKLCRDIVGSSRWQLVAKWCVVGRQLLFKTNRKPYPRNSVVPFQLPSLTP